VRGKGKEICSTRKVSQKTQEDRTGENSTKGGDPGPTRYSSGKRKGRARAKQDVPNFFPEYFLHQKD